MWQGFRAFLGLSFVPHGSKYKVLTIMNAEIEIRALTYKG